MLDWMMRDRERARRADPDPRPRHWRRLIERGVDPAALAAFLAEHISSGRLVGRNERSSPAWRSPVSVWASAARGRAGDIVSTGRLRLVDARPRRAPCGHDHGASNNPALGIRARSSLSNSIRWRRSNMPHQDRRLRERPRARRNRSGSIAVAMVDAEQDQLGVAAPAWRSRSSRVPSPIIDLRAEAAGDVDRSRCLVSIRVTGMPCGDQHLRDGLAEAAVADDDARWRRRRVGPVALVVAAGSGSRRAARSAIIRNGVVAIDSGDDRAEQARRLGRDQQRLLRLARTGRSRTRRPG